MTSAARAEPRCASDVTYRPEAIRNARCLYALRHRKHRKFKVYDDVFTVVSNDRTHTRRADDVIRDSGTEAPNRRCVQ
jgi:hypothetical protein